MGTGVGCSSAEQESLIEMLISMNSGNAAKALQVAQFLCDKMNSTRAEMDDVEGELNQTNISLDGAYIMFSTSLVFFMQMGFAMLCAGAVRSKNCMNICLMNVLDPCFSAPAFFLVGYGFAHGNGTPSNGFIGNNSFALEDFQDWHQFIFQWAFAAAAATITTGSVAERCTFQAYIGYSIFLSGFVYPIVAHWIWSPQGWLTGFRDDAFLDSGMIDFAGSGVVHMVGGLAGLVGAYIMGPRSGRFDSNGKPTEGFEGHSMTLVVIGTLTLWFGWFGFNPGSQLAIHGKTDLEIVGRAAVCTTLSGAMGGITSLLFLKIKTGKWDPGAVCNGLLCGLVSVTAGCSVIEPAAALLCGFVASFVFEGMCALLLKLKIDDPLAAAPMHGFCGMWGVLFVGLMAKEQYVRQVYGRIDESIDIQYGLFYGGGGKLLACQLTGILCIAAWTIGVTGPFFYLFHMTGNLRVPEEDEMMGLDASHHGGSCYPSMLVDINQHQANNQQLTALNKLKVVSIHELDRTVL